jgi:hypothetical protein
MGYYNEGDSGETVLGKLAKKFNVRLTEDSLKTGAFVASQSDLMDDLTVVGKPALRALVRMMGYGSGFDSDLAKLAVAGEDVAPAEQLVRTHVLRNNFLRWQSVSAAAKADFEKIAAVVEEGLAITPEVKALLARFKVSREGGVLGFFSEDAFDLNAVSPLTPAEEYRQLAPEEFLVQLDANRKLLDFDSLMLDGVLPVNILNAISESTEAKFAEVKTMSVLEKLYHHDDFKFSLGMYYAHKMCREMGIESEIQWVPSYPLGANVVTLAELSAAYQTILTGRTWRYFESGSENQVLVLERIEDLNGQLIWEAEGRSHQLVDVLYSAPMLSILRSTVTHGTAYAAHNSILLSAKLGEAKLALEKAAIRVPTFGKTGTTNEYVNATYVGFLPYPELEGAKELTPDAAYTIAAYVGYDNNEPMRRGQFKVAGGTGALPAWIEAANALVREKDFASKLNWKSLVQDKVKDVPFQFGSGLSAVRVGVHSSVIADATDVAEADEQAEDANTYSDYAVTRKGLMSVPLPGTVERGIFVPKRRVQFFDSRMKQEKGL